jgi:hypothetical protein
MILKCVGNVAVVEALLQIARWLMIFHKALCYL